MSCKLLIFIPVFIALLFSTSVHSTVLFSPKVTNYGKWGEMGFCPQNTFVMGMKVKMDERTSGRDKTALNGIEMFCGNQDHRGSSSITSTVGNSGSWQASQYCRNDFATGFQLQSNIV